MDKETLIKCKTELDEANSKVLYVSDLLEADGSYRDKKILVAVSTILNQYWHKIDEDLQDLPKEEE